MVELVVTSNGSEDRGTESLRASDTEASDETADGDVDEHVRFAVLGSDEQSIPPNSSVRISTTERSTTHINPRLVRSTRLA
jgi:hypothetical protein